MPIENRYGYYYNGMSNTITKRNTTHSTRKPGGRAFHRLGSDSTRDIRFLILVGDIFEGLLLGLGDKKCGENSCQHKEGKDFHDVFNEFVLATDVDQLAET